MKKIGLVIHGGAGDETLHLKNHLKEYEQGLKEAIKIAYHVLKNGGSALDTVEAAVVNLEDNPHFNAGKGSALNNQGEVEMDAAIMDGKTQSAGAVSMVRNVKNPIILARTIMNKTKHVFLSGYGALDFAKQSELTLEPEAYFITDYAYEEFLHYSKGLQEKMEKKVYGSGTVGAVALDENGNIAAATSTGGITNSLAGRIGDSCVIGAGCYANNDSCAVSGTGEGEILITDVIAHSIAMTVEFKKISLQKACDYVILERKRQRRGNIGVISIDPKGNIGICFSGQVMKRAWVTSDSEEVNIGIY